MNLIYAVVVGGVAGWFAGILLKGRRGFGIIGNVVIGIAGAFVGHLILGITGFQSGGGIAATLITATVGAVVLLTAIRAIKKS